MILSATLVSVRDSPLGQLRSLKRKINFEKRKTIKEGKHVINNHDTNFSFLGTRLETDGTLSNGYSN